MNKRECISMLVSLAHYDLATEATHEKIFHKEGDITFTLNCLSLDVKIYHDTSLIWENGALLNPNEAAFLAKTQSALHARLLKAQEKETAETRRALAHRAEIHEAITRRNRP